MRAVSTVVDATLFLLVLGVAVATVLTVPMLSDGDDPTDHADAIAEHLATGTERVEYSLAPAARALEGDPPIRIRDGRPFHRSAHGTFVSLLADGAVATMTVDGTALSRDGEAFATVVAKATEHRIASRNVSVAVVAVWEPYSDAPIEGRVTAGREPPATVDVNAATVTVDAPIPAGRERAVAATGEEGFDGVAAIVAESVVTGLFPPNRTQLALRGEYPVDALVANRYAGAREAFGGELAAPDGSTDVAAANAELAATLSGRIERDLRDRYATPTAAARNVSTGTVTVTVRTWSR